MSLIQKMKNPEENKAQSYLTTEALAGADWLKKGDFSSLPKGMFFDFQMPGEQLKQYNSAANATKTGTFALGAGDDGGMSGRVMDTQSKYLADKFGRDTAQNYQNNIAGVGQKVQGALTQASGAKSGNDAAIMSALQGLMSSPMLNKPGIGGALIGALGSIGGGALSSMAPWSI